MPIVVGELYGMYYSLRSEARIAEQSEFIGRDPFNQNFRKFRSKTQWIGSVQPEKFRKNGSTFWGGPLFPVGPVWILVEWIALIVSSGEKRARSVWAARGPSQLQTRSSHLYL